MPTSAPGLGSPRPHLHSEWAHPAHICSRTGLTSPTSAPGLGSPRPHLLQDWAHACHICTGTGLAPPTSAQRVGSRLPHLHREWAHACHICTGTGLTPAASAPGLRLVSGSMGRLWEVQGGTVGATRSDRGSIHRGKGRSAGFHACEWVLCAACASGAGAGWASAPVTRRV